MDTVSSVGTDRCMPPVLCLPVELYEKIGRHFDSTTDVANARYASRILAQAFLPFLVEELKINIMDDIYKGNLFDFAIDGVLFVPIPTTLVPYITKLAIYLGFWFPQSLSLVNRLTTEIYRLISLRHFEMAWAERVRSSVTPGSDSFRRMMAVEEGLLAAVLNSHRDTLESLDLGYSLIFSPASTTTLSLTTFTSLRSIKFYDVGSVNGAFIAQAKQVLQHNTALENLDITLLMHDGDDIIILPSLLPSRSTTPILPLRNLRLESQVKWLPSSSLTDVSSFSYLTRLTIISSAVAHEFWDILRASNARLQYLHLANEFHPALTTYLTSFKGLRDLLLDLARQKVQGVYPELLAPVLHHHSATLQRLFLTAPACLYSQPKEHGSSFDSAWPSPHLFPNLKYLTTWSPVGWTLDNSTSQRMLDWLEQFPSMEHSVTDWRTPDITTLFSGREAGKSLLGRTGRPKHWSWWSVRGEKFNTVTWNVQSVSDEWSFVACPYQHDHNLEWE